MAGGIRIRMSKVKKAVTDSAYQAHDQTVAQVRERYMGRWMEELGITDKAQFDSASDPAVHIEWLLCDPVIWDMAKHREDEWLAMLTEEERWTYFNKTDEYGAHYPDVVKANMFNPVTAARSADAPSWTS